MGPVEVLILRNCAVEKKACVGSPLKISDLLTIDDEARALGHLVVELHGGRVGLVGLPVDAWGSCLLCAFIDGFDESMADALTARRLGGEQVLQVADGGDMDRAAVEKVVHQTEEFAVSLGYEGVHWLVGVKESRPCHLCNFSGKGRAAVEQVVALPERQPFVEICAGYGANGELGGHD